uniref:HMG box-containing protein 1 n=3 Tax=Nothobranchius kuhntae TaxID=321403 RepID=A0A1A8HRT6_NOTKU
MVWEVVKPALLSDDPESRNTHGTRREAKNTGVMNAHEDQSHDPLRCDEHFLSSPSFPTSDVHMEYDDLPDLQEVKEELAALPVYQVEAGVSHQERLGHTHTSPPPDALWLTQLAHIATSPQSPLLQEPQSRFFSANTSSSSSDLHSYARPPPALPSSTGFPSGAPGRERRRSRTSSECGSAVSTWSSLSDDEDMGWSFSWPPTAWHCFLKGTHLRFHCGSRMAWQDVEDLESNEDSADEELSRFLKSYGSEGLQLVEHEETVSSGQAVLQLTFDPGAFGHTPVTARCQLDHPFYVKTKGWSSFNPSLTVVHFGIPCYEMEVGDTCLPPGHRDAKHTDDSLVFDTFKSYDFTPLDSSAVYVLSSMARRRRASQSSGGAVSPDRDSVQDCHSPSHLKHQKTTKKQCVKGGTSAPPTKCKRPMNAFMLFAKRFRVEYTQMYPGKDNRAISVLLGEQWKKLRSEDRQVFILQARALADEQKRLNPDCWKRKRNNSGSQGT